MARRLGTKRPRLEDLSPDAKRNKRVAILRQFQRQRQPQNWLSLAVDIVINIDGVHNFMHYFAHLPGRRKRRACLIVRLLTADSTTKSSQRPARELAEARRRNPVAHRLNQLSAKAGLAFHRLFSCDGAHAAAGASASSRASPSSRIRRHKHRHRERLHFLEIPYADLLAVAPEDRQPA
jgi:hypothetical protein